MKNVVYYKLWVEYEYGQEDVVFKNKDDALAWLKEVVEGEGYFTVEQLEEDGLFGIKSVDLWEPEV